MKTCTRSSAGKYLAVICLFALVLASTLAFAQETTGGITGTVKDPQGAVVSGATVEVSGSALITGTRTAKSDNGGNYRFSNLPPGTYDISVTASGFGSAKQTGLKLDVGALPTVNFSLKVGAASEVIEVSGEAQIVDVTTSKVQTSVSHEILSNIPTGRSFQSVIPFAPGSRQEPMQSRRDDAAGRANGFQIDGASDSENVYLVEGINTTNINEGGIGRQVPMEFIQEVQIKSSSFEAEFGGALGGVINVTQKRGSNAWHGSVFSYYRSSNADANDQCLTRGFVNTQCGLRLAPAPALQSNTGSTVNAAGQTPYTSAVSQYYIQKQDHYRIVEPGFEVGGPLLKNRLWLFASYAPSFDRTRRNTVYTGAANIAAGVAGQRDFYRTIDVHNGLARIDYKVFNSLTVFGAWQYGYSRTTGSLGNIDSALGQVNTGSGIDPRSIRSDNGSVNPSSVYTFGADWTPTSHVVVSGRYGYFFNNGEARGLPVGIRYLYNQNASATTTTLSGAVIPVAFQANAPFANIPSNFQQLFDAFKRKSMNLDGSYFVSKFGTHNFKVGYARTHVENDLLTGFNTALVTLDWGQAYGPAGTSVGTANCAAIAAANIVSFGAAAGQCRGNYGFFTVSDGVDSGGNAKSTSHAIYFQDGWNVGHGLTINAGVRFDKEFLPPYSVGADSISFGFGSKIAPRIGGAYDVLHNGKLKIYASYGKFFDIMKYNLPRGSFGGEYWHDCVYALDNPDYTLITPTGVPHACIAGGPAVTAPGVVVGRFIENSDFRKNVLSLTDPGVDPNIKPMEQHEFVVGSDWAINKNLGLEIRYARKVLDRTIEDIGITDNDGFRIGNPGTVYGDLLRRVTDNYPGIVCPTCPKQPGAIRNYNGIEFRLTKRASAKWFGSVSYTYSRLTGNYSGLTDSDVTDGNGGRHSPNNHRAFDNPQMQFDSHGKVIDGVLATDRPHTLKMFGWYNLHWFAGTTTLGFDQSIFSGTPLSTCVPTILTASSCVFVEGRGNWVNFTRAANGDFVSSIENNKRTQAYIQTDAHITHEFKVSKTNEAMRVGFEANVNNLFNQRATITTYPNPFVSGAVVPVTPPDLTGYNFLAMLTGWNYMALINGPVGIHRTLDARYGLPNLTQANRQIRFKVKFVF